MDLTFMILDLRYIWLFFLCLAELKIESTIMDCKYETNPNTDNNKAYKNKP
jgi:hypothetical protein